LHKDTNITARWNIIKKKWKTRNTTLSVKSHIKTYDHFRKWRQKPTWSMISLVEYREPRVIIKYVLWFAQLSSYIGDMLTDNGRKRTVLRWMWACNQVKHKSLAAEVTYWLLAEHTTMRFNLLHYVNNVHVNTIITTRYRVNSPYRDFWFDHFP
jgi:hypothetical protein